MRAAAQLRQKKLRTTQRPKPLHNSARLFRFICLRVGSSSKTEIMSIRAGERGKRRESILIGKLSLVGDGGFAGEGRASEVDAPPLGLKEGSGQ